MNCPAQKCFFPWPNSPLGPDLLHTLPHHEDLFGLGWSWWCQGGPPLFPPAYPWGHDDISIAKFSTSMNRNCRIKDPTSLEHRNPIQTTILQADTTFFKRSSVPSMKTNKQTFPIITKGSILLSLCNDYRVVKGGGFQGEGVLMFPNLP